MEGIVIGILILVIAVKAGTAHRLTHLETSIRRSKSEETEVQKDLQGTEKTLRQLEQDQKTLDQELKHLENDKDLLLREIVRLGGSPVPESKLDEEAPAASPAQSEGGPKSQEDRPDPSEQEDGDTDPKGERETTGSGGEGEAEQGENADSASDVGRSAHPRKHRILIVDDNEDLRDLLIQALGEEFDVLESPDGLDALHKILEDNEECDLVVTDLTMPKVNGITLVENLPKNVPTIIISAFLKKPGFHEAIQKLKPVGIFEKPFAISGLRQAIRDALKV